MANSTTEICPNYRALTPYILILTFLLILLNSVFTYLIFKAREHFPIKERSPFISIAS
jgi:hypothetical protein